MQYLAEDTETQNSIVQPQAVVPILIYFHGPTFVEKRREKEEKGNGRKREEKRANQFRLSKYIPDKRSEKGDRK